MKSERSIRGLACRWCLAAVMALLACLLAPSRAQAQVQTFFVNVPAASEPRDAMELCRDRFTAALVRVGGFRANQDAVTQQSVTDCLGETASATAKRECEVSMANIEVDFLILPVVRRIGEQWNWSIKALSPAQGAAQVWGGDGSSVEADAVRAAYGACDSLAKEFACEQGVVRACSGFGGGPLLGADGSGPAENGGARPAVRRVNVSALDVFDVTPTEVAVWIDGKESGTSANQVTGIPPGEHEVTLKATGYFDQSQRVLFEAGKPAVLQRIRLKKTTASLVVSMTVPSEATVLVGGRERGRSGTSLSGIAPGTTDVVIRAPGYRERREPVAFIADEEARIDRVSLEPLPATLTVTANIMGAEVLVDGQVVGETTGGADAFEVVSSAKQLEVRRSGFTPVTQRLALRPGGGAAVMVTLSRGAVANTPTGETSAAGDTVGCPAGYVPITSGRFMMGVFGAPLPDAPDYRVDITRPYCMKVTEVTQGEWRAVMGSNPSYFKECGMDCPVEQVGWADIIEFANRHSRRERLPECYVDSTLTGLDCTGYRLPTEAEWEYASIGRAFGANNSWERDSVAWHNKNAAGSTHSVRQKPPNLWGLYDMLGNVWEWTGDGYGDLWLGLAINPLGLPNASTRVIRGGSWNDLGDYVSPLYRSMVAVGFRASNLGFRLVRTSLVSETPKDSVAPSSGAHLNANKGCPAGYVRIEPGTFTMGSPTSELGREGDETQHSVTITRAYCMKATEVTQGEWQSVTGRNPSKFTDCGLNCPVEQVSWDDAVEYANALSWREGLPECYSGSTFTGLTCSGYRLPTESEWEYAARSGTTGATYRNLGSSAWYHQNARGTTHEVRQKQPNSWGLHEMLGNVWEWTNDWYGSYPGTVTDPTGATTGSNRVARGGSWSALSRNARAADRFADTPGNRNIRLGFRLVRNAP
jgi:formylglycine-generating enzyme required for sulfatase activity